MPDLNRKIGGSTTVTPAKAGPATGTATGTAISAIAGTATGTAPATGTATPATPAKADIVAVNSSFPNFIKLIVLICPFFIVLLLVVLSIINSDVKGFIYLAGTLFLFIIALAIQKMIPNNKPKETCSLWNTSIFKFPSFISALYTFTITYVIYPMITHNTFNYPLITIFLIIYISDIVIRTIMGCSDTVNVMLGSVLGIIFALFYIIMLSQSPHPQDVLYYNDFVSNKLACSVPSKQTFKCSFKNNGELKGHTVT